MADLVKITTYLSPVYQRKLLDTKVEENAEEGGQIGTRITNKYEDQPIEDKIASWLEENTLGHMERYFPKDVLKSHIY